ncbi:hypothetical protein ACLB1T_23075 [Escherichia coli]
MAETPKLIFSAAEAPKVKEASKAARTNFFMMELPSVNLMIFSCWCLRHAYAYQVNLYAINMIK